jgi:predicted Fe-Mo cluster-binding NifX family protein
MDVLNLYQEDAAKKMEVSRPTFTRILKSARQKLAIGLVSGYKIVLEDDKKDLIVALCVDDINSFELIDSKQKYILIYHIENNKINLLHQLDNPVFIKQSKPAIELPKILLEYNVNTFISSKIGEGLKNSLISKGINPIIKENFKHDDLTNME